MTLRRDLKPAPPEIWYKMQRVLRTAFQMLITLLGVWASLQVAMPQIMAQLATVLPGSWIIWLTGAVGVITAVAAAISGIMTLPAVNALLTKIGLGGVPKSALVTLPSGNTGVLPDPKAVGK
jgi:hypothetical protein